MSEGTRIPWAEARALADELLVLLGPYCERLEVVGSIRRKRPTIGDIELLAVPKQTEVMATDLFGERPDQAVTLDELHDRCNALFTEHVLSTRLDKNGRRAFGHKYKRLHYRGVGLDLFAVLKPAQWGVLSVIRTGSADFSHRLVTPVEQGGWMPGDLYCRDGSLWTTQGDPILTPQEIHVFDALGRPYVPPELREVPP